MIEAFGLDISALALDMTNFATYIDSTNDRAPITQRGKVKQKRADLRLVGMGLVGLGLVGLGLVVTRDGGVPLVSHAYPGNQLHRGRRILWCHHGPGGVTGGGDDRGVRRRTELGRQRRPPGRHRSALRRLGAALRLPRPARSARHRQGTGRR
ncbi:MAG: hypothetical protein ABIZ05_11900 [Pseudonocardiaceae bacterium]